MLVHLFGAISSPASANFALRRTATEYHSSWEKWLAGVPKLLSFSICRSVFPEAFGPVVSSQLHHFSDASEAGFGSVSYLRLVNDEGRNTVRSFCKVSACTSEIRFYSSFGALRCYFICPP